MSLKDLLNQVRTTTGQIISTENPFEDYYIIRVQPSRHLKWQPGEHAIIIIPNPTFKGKNWRILSIASIKEDGYLRFATRTGKNPSEFKDFLIHAAKGTKIKIRRPFGSFKLQDNSCPVVLYADGVGITPVIAISKQLATDSRVTHIIYSSSNYYLFEKEILEIVDNNPSMDIHFTKTTEETHSILSELAITYGNNAYCLSNVR